jgi:hypothetical protein
MATRFDAVLAAHAGDARQVLHDLEHSFIDWTASPDDPDIAAGARWRSLVVAVAAAGPPGVAAEPALFVGAVAILATQLGALPVAAVEDSIRDALGDLADDLADHGAPGLAGAATILRSAL